ncbi:diuretic hormone class 2 isoform X1 [Leguminivora glycinivorella]|uniref:diuretic hormone class 2 isoform X1 n=1 Tax=Leguminivora glycinivorella TaxID=1035111 RepID=UPI00200E0F72|nr:diuretic hormone class 2 isoform X1 [Leguminivora glycinivorella]
MVRASCVLASCALVGLLLAVPAASYPRYQNNYYRNDGPYNPEEIMDMLNRLGNLIQMERKMENFKDDITSYKDDITSEKRAIDLGLSRGYSGAMQAKHLLGLAAANYEGGPGRRRRDAH